MSEERFARIESRLDDLSRGQDELRRGQDELRRGLGELRQGQGEVRRDIDDLKTGQAELRRHMGVLHEEVIERIQALAFDPAPLRREFRAADAELREELLRRIEPLEAAGRRKPRR